MRLGVWLVGLLFFLGLGTAEGAIRVTLDGDRLSVSAENAPLQDILQAVATAGHFALQLEVPLADRVTILPEQRSLLDTLEALLQDQSSLIRYTRQPEGVQVEEVRVFAPSPPPRPVEAALPPEVTPAASLPPVPTADAPPDRMKPPSATATIPPSPPDLATERIAAALALAGGDRAEAGQEILEDLLRTSAEPEVRGRALAALSVLGDVPLASVAAVLADGDGDPGVRLFALTLVGDRAKSDPAARALLGDFARDGVAGEPPEGEPDLKLVATIFLDAARSGKQ